MKKFGIALGGGGARGFAHVGVLKVLIEAGLRPQVVAGTSAGGLVGAMYAAGLDWVWVEKLARSLPWGRLFDLTVSPGGLISGRRFLALFHTIFHDRHLEDLPVPLALTAVDLASGDLVVMDSGPLVPALRATISVPGVFTPVRQGDMVLVDGGVLDIVPADVARRMGADIVLAVDLTARGPVSPGQLRSARDVLFRAYDVMTDSISQKALAQADIVIRPGFAHVGTFDFRYADRLITAGEARTSEILPVLRDLLLP